MLVTLGVALLAAGGIKWVLERGIDGSKVGWIWLPVAALTLFEFLPVPYPTLPGKVPQAACRLTSDSTHPIVLNLPLGRCDGIGMVGDFDAAALLMQTAHHRPIIGGYVPRMTAMDRGAFEEGILGNLVLVQATASSPSPVEPRAEVVKDWVRRLAARGHPALKLLKLVAGEERIQRIVNPPDSPTTQRELQPLSPASASVEADRLGIGHIVAINPTRPQVRAALEYLQGLLDLSLLDGDGNFAFYRVNYPPAIAGPGSSGVAD